MRDCRNVTSDGHFEKIAGNDELALIEVVIEHVGRCG